MTIGEAVSRQRPSSGAQIELLFLATSSGPPSDAVR
jgi:hypothetical protein